MLLKTKYVWAISKTNKSGIYFGITDVCSPDYRQMVKLYIKKILLYFMNWRELGMVVIFSMHCNGKFDNGDKADQFWKDVSIEG